MHFGAASKKLGPSAFRGCVDQVWLCSRLGEAVVLDHGVDREGRTTFALTLATVATVHNERPGFHAITYVYAVAATFEWKGWSSVIWGVGRCWY